MPTTETAGSGSSKVVRIVLDPGATQACAEMIARLKEQNSWAGANPSAFVSFLVSDFYATYFEKDLSVLVAEFFDSEKYYSAKAKSAGAEQPFEEIMMQVLEDIRKTKSKARRTEVRRKNSSSSEVEANS